MGDFGDILEGLGALSGTAESGGIIDVVTGLLGRKQSQQAGDSAVTYERYLCGAPRDLNVNDR